MHRRASVLMLAGLVLAGCGGERAEETGSLGLDRLERIGDQTPAGEAFVPVEPDAVLDTLEGTFAFPAFCGREAGSVTLFDPAEYGAVASGGGTATQDLAMVYDGADFAHVWIGTATLQAVSPLGYEELLLTPDTVALSVPDYTFAPPWTSLSVTPDENLLDHGEYEPLAMRQDTSGSTVQPTTQAGFLENPGAHASLHQVAAYDALDDMGDITLILDPYRLALYRSHGGQTAHPIMLGTGCAESDTVDLATRFNRRTEASEAMKTFVAQVFPAWRASQQTFLTAQAVHYSDYLSATTDPDTGEMTFGGQSVPSGMSRETFYEILIADEYLAHAGRVFGAMEGWLDDDPEATYPSTIQALLRSMLADDAGRLYTDVTKFTTPDEMETGLRNLAWHYNAAIQYFIERTAP